MLGVLNCWEYFSLTFQTCFHISLFQVLPSDLTYVVNTSLLCPGEKRLLLKTKSREKIRKTSSSYIKKFTLCPELFKFLTGEKSKKSDSDITNIILGQKPNNPSTVQGSDLRTATVQAPYPEPGCRWQKRPTQGPSSSPRGALRMRTPPRSRGAGPSCHLAPYGSRRRLPQSKAGAEGYPTQTGFLFHCQPCSAALPRLLSPKYELTRRPQHDFSRGSSRCPSRETERAGTQPPLQPRCRTCSCRQRRATSSNASWWVAAPPTPGSPGPGAASCLAAMAPARLGPAPLGSLFVREPARPYPRLAGPATQLSSLPARPLLPESSRRSHPGPGRAGREWPVPSAAPGGRHRNLLSPVHPSYFCQHPCVQVFVHCFMWNLLHSAPRHLWKRERSCNGMGSDLYR